MNVLSLFDGMSCGQIALERAGIEVDNYFASEIDKHAMAVCKANYPNTKHIGDVTQVKAEDLPKIDLLIGGSPCQGFSFAGKQLNFEDPRSKLFFEFVRLLKECKPKYWMLENVKMKKEVINIISEYLGVQPIEINSALVSAQNRKRLFWTNIPGIKQPKDKSVFLADIIETGIVDRNKSYCIDANYYKSGNLKQYFEKSRRQLVFCGAIRGRYIANGSGTTQKMEIRYDGKTNTITTVQKDNNAVFIDGFRKLTPLECERLQTVPDNYTASVSNTQRYKMLGNGWTIDVIAHIFSFLS
jgi:DNA-cytosine methyltransferase